VQHGGPIWYRLSGEHGGNPRQPRGDPLRLIHSDLDCSGGYDLFGGRGSSATPVSDPTSDTHPPKPYDIIQGMEHVISMMEDTL
jgi:hypothetical protein